MKFYSHISEKHRNLRRKLKTISKMQLITTDGKSKFFRKFSNSIHLSCSFSNQQVKIPSDIMRTNPSLHSKQVKTTQQLGKEHQQEETEDEIHREKIPKKDGFKSRKMVILLSRISLCFTLSTYNKTIYHVSLEKSACQLRQVDGIYLLGFFKKCLFTKEGYNKITMIFTKSWIGVGIPFHLVDLLPSGSLAEKKKQ